MANLSDIKVGTILEINGDPYKVFEASTSKISQAKNVLKMRLKNLSNGKVISKSMQGSDKVDLADITWSEAQFLYADDQNFYFMDNVSFDQFALTREQIGRDANYLKEGTAISIVNNHGKPVAIEIPIKVDLRVTDAPPGIKGDTAQGGNKEVETETGLKVHVPLFIETGDVVRVNTENGAYVERVN